MDKLVIDVLKVVIGTYVAIILLYALLRLGKRFPNGLGAFFQGASKLATPPS